MNKPLPVIYCKSCFYTQDYRGQTECIHCGRGLSNWSVATQVQAFEAREKTKREEVKDG